MMKFPIYVKIKNVPNHQSDMDLYGFIWFYMDLSSSYGLGIVWINRREDE